MPALNLALIVYKLLSVRHFILRIFLFLNFWCWYIKKIVRADNPQISMKCLLHSYTYLASVMKLGFTLLVFQGNYRKSTNSYSSVVNQNNNNLFVQQKEHIFCQGFLQEHRTIFSTQVFARTFGICNRKKQNRSPLRIRVRYCCTIPKCKIPAILFFHFGSKAIESLLFL